MTYIERVKEPSLPRNFTFHPLVGADIAQSLRELVNNIKLHSQADSIFRQRFGRRGIPSKSVFEQIGSHSIYGLGIKDEKGKLIACGELASDTSELYLAVLVHPDYQRQGIGRFLTSSLVEHAAVIGIKSVMVTVLADNPQATGLLNSQLPGVEITFIEEMNQERLFRLEWMGNF